MKDNFYMLIYVIKKFIEYLSQNKDTFLVKLFINELTSIFSNFVFKRR